MRTMWVSSSFEKELRMLLFSLISLHRTTAIDQIGLFVERKTTQVFYRQQNIRVVNVSVRCWWTANALGGNTNCESNSIVADT